MKTPSNPEKVTAELTPAELESVLKARARQRQETPFREMTPEQQSAHLRKMGVPTL